MCLRCERPNMCSGAVVLISINCKLLHQRGCRFYLAWMVIFATSGKLMKIFEDDSKLTDEELTVRTNTLTVGMRTT
jgi:hypothetical protein